jgi:hypothetical protein
MSIQHDAHTGEVTCWPSCGAANRRWVDPAVWSRDDMRGALAAHDIGTVFRLLQRHGVSQRRIAARTGQSQSEISEILAGRRVTSYAVLVRIAEGLGVNRGLMGLAFVSEDVAARR